MIYCKDCLNDGNCINPGYYNASLRSECFRDKDGEKLKPSVAEILNPQPIQKAPSFQITEEEARKILEVATILRKRGDMEIWIGNLKHAGYIRKSELVELVEEAEWIYENYQSAKYCLTTDEALEKNHDALQALKKDHPEFGGKVRNEMCRIDNNY